MKILHMADTHLGYSAYRKLTKDGVNQREIDIYNSFKKCIDYIIKSKPDLVIHAGDLFDSVRPTNRAISVALKQIIRLSLEKIPFIVISGNHETPKLKETGNIFKIFDHLDHIYPIYNNNYEKTTFEINNKKIIIHAVPHCQTKEGFLDIIKKVQPDKSADFNVFVAHGAVTGIKEFKMNEFNELFIPIDSLIKDFNYVALGHYHNYTKIAENAFYSGSTERLTFAEVEGKKGFIKIELGNKTKCKFIEIPTRFMIDIPVFNCSNQNVEDITKNIIETIKKIKPDDKIIRIRLKNISLLTYRGIDFNQIRKICSRAVHFEIKSNIINEGEKNINENSKIESIADEFEKFLQDKEIKEKDHLLKLGLKYIQKVELKDEGR